MNVNLDQYKNIADKFKHVDFFSDGHRYLISGNEAVSVTSLLKQYVKPFERDYWANIKAQQTGVDIGDILAKWEFSAKFSQVKGTLVHEFIESKLTSGQFIYPEDVIIQSFGYDPIQTPFNQILPVVEQFLSDIDNKMLPILSEFVIGDLEYLVAGTIDQLFYNKKSTKLEIWDWKTNKEIKLESRYFHLPPLNHIPDTELDHYSLQLSVYRLILEKNTQLELGDSYLVWFNENSPKYTIYKARDYRAEAQIILQGHRNVN